MKWHQRTRVMRVERAFTAYEPPDSKVRRVVTRINCNSEGGFERTDYTPAFNPRIEMLQGTLKSAERQLIESAAAEPGETVTFDRLLAEIIAHDPPNLAKFDRAIIPKEWLTPVPCHRTTIYFVPEYRVVEVDIRAKTDITVGSDSYRDGEEIGDFVLFYPNYIRLYRTHEWDEKCCSERPEERPEDGYRNAYPYMVDRAIKKAREEDPLKVHKREE